jgi:hypothetical protein
MAGETSAPRRARPSGRVWLVLVCALTVIVFLAVVTPAAFDVRHEERSREITRPIKRLVLDSKGTVKLEIKPSRDGHVHLLRSSDVSRDSRLVERVKVSGTTLTIDSSCTGSRLGVLRRCNLHYHLRLPRKTALALRLHFGAITLKGIQGRLDLKLDAGKFDGFGCNKRADVSLRFGGIDYRDSCVPKYFRARMSIGDIALRVPAGRYNVHVEHRAKRPFANIIEDPSSPDEIDAEVSLGGSIAITGARR